MFNKTHAYITVSFVVYCVLSVLFAVCCFLFVNCGYMHGFDVVSLVCMVLAWVSLIFWVIAVICMGFIGFR